MDIGSLAEWAGALSGLAALLVAVQANRQSRKSEKYARETESLSVELNRQIREEQRQTELAMHKREQERDHRDMERDRRLIAGGLQAWWAYRDQQDTCQQWGLVVSNEGSQVSIFYNVQIDVEVQRITTRPLCIKVLPPGRYFAINRFEQGWELPEECGPSQTHALLSSTRHQVVRISFQDSLGKRWVWNPQEGLNPS